MTSDADKFEVLHDRVQQLETETQSLRSNLGERDAQIQELEREFKARATSRLGALWTLQKDYRAYLRGELEGFPEESVRGAIHAFILPRMVLVVGSVVGALVLLAQAGLIWQQNRLVQQSNAILAEQFAEQRRAAVATERSQYVRAIYDLCLDCPVDENGDFPLAASPRARSEAARGLAAIASGDGTGVDLSDADLDGADFADLAFPNANFARSSLVGASLQGANLQRAYMFQADLSDARLWGADLRNAGLLIVDFTGANLEGADLSGAELNASDFSGADLSGANLTGAILSGTRYNADTTWPDNFVVVPEMVFSE